MGDEIDGWVGWMEGKLWLTEVYDPIRNGRRGGMDALALTPGTRYAREGRFAGDPALGCFRGRGICLCMNARCHVCKAGQQQPLTQHHQSTPQKCRRIQRQLALHTNSTQI